MVGFPARIRHAAGYAGAIVGLAMGGLSIAAAALAVVLSSGMLLGAAAAAVAVAVGVAITAFSCARVGDTEVGEEALTLGTWINLRKTPLPYADMTQVALQDYGTDKADYRILIVMSDGRTFSLEESRLNPPGERSGPTTLDLLLDYLVARIRERAGSAESR